MADAPATPSLPPPPASAGDGDPPSPSAPVPRVLPSTMFLDTPPPSRGMAQGPRGRGGRAAAAVPVPRVLPATMFLDTPPPSSCTAPRGPCGRGGGRAAAASGSGGRGGGGGGGTGRTSALPAATSYGTGGSKPNRLSVNEAIMKHVPATDGGARRLPPADDLDLAMANGSLFEWLGYWPENGFPNEGHRY